MNKLFPQKYYKLSVYTEVGCSIFKTFANCEFEAIGFVCRFFRNEDMIKLYKIEIIEIGEGENYE